MKKFLMLIVIFSFLLSDMANAAIPDTLSDLDVRPENVDSVEKRRIIAKALLEQLTSFDASIPNLTPAEAEWLQDEYKAVNNTKGGLAKVERFGQLYNSAEFHIERLKGILRQIDYPLGRIINNKLRLRAEIENWSEVVEILMNTYDRNESLKLLQDRGKIQLTDDIKLELLLVLGDNPWGFYFRTSQHIQLYIVRYYLMGLLNE